MSRQNSTVLSNEKIEGIVEHIEEGVSTDAEAKEAHDSHAGVNAEHMPDYKSKEVRRILRKVDFRLIPLLTTLYVMSFLDRSNLGNAAIAGMTEDLELVGHRYNVSAPLKEPTASLGLLLNSARLR
jgi:hypothetical protein